MILVGVGEDDSDQFISMLFDIAQIGNGNVHPEQILIWKHEPAIHDDHLVIKAEDGHIGAKLTQTT